MKIHKLRCAINCFFTFASEFDLRSCNVLCTSLELNEMKRFLKELYEEQNTSRTCVHGPKPYRQKGKTELALRHSDKCLERLYSRWNLRYRNKWCEVCTKILIRKQDCKRCEEFTNVLNRLDFRCCLPLNTTMEHCAYRCAKARSYRLFW